MAEKTIVDDILNDMMMEESGPSNAGLVRWCERYPEHSEALMRFFGTWSIQTALPEDEVFIDEEKLIERGRIYALGLMYEQDRNKPFDPVAFGFEKQHDRFFIKPARNREPVGGSVWLSIVGHEQIIISRRGEKIYCGCMPKDVASARTILQHLGVEVQ